MTIRSVLILLGGGAVMLGVLGYNLWSYSCGYCTLRSLLTLGLPGYLLLVLNLILLSVWLIMRRRRAREVKGDHCRCGTALAGEWHYCPGCGEATGR
ncbi:hypothetical protein JCM30471_07290 [Desulfuromonas carbonis]|uniref:hypothetical protein n=1 Tax=Desulfuromonas sp. DDH964 TaxID=1823759 RepID=UPI00078E5F35|nr:hypothetical protein [Desulfuromonas sp. DDH964]AMV72244.1 hypothetical protein DBW_1891 [Desulfuromonas sp. DDH964]